MVRSALGSRRLPRRRVLLTVQLVTAALVSVSTRALAALAGGVAQNVNECWPLSLSAPATAIICGVVGAGCLSLCVTSWVRVHGALFGFGGWIVVVLVLLEDFFEILVDTPRQGNGGGQLE